MITEDGRAALRKAAPVYLQGIEQEFLSHLTSAERETLERALRKVLDAQRGRSGRTLRRLIARDPAAHPAAEPRRFYVRTYGCQMNEHDSERIAGLLASEGMEADRRPRVGRRRRAEHVLHP